MTVVTLVSENDRLRILWFGTVASKVGGGLRQIALPWLVLVLTGSPVQLGITVALQAAPAAVFAPVLGHVIDRRSRKRLLVGGAVGVGLTLVVLAVLGWYDVLRIEHVYVAMLALALFETLSYNARRATMPTFVDDGRLDEANALLYGTGAAVSLGAILTGGLLTDWVGPVLVLGASGIAALVSAVILLGLSLPSREIRPVSPRGAVTDLRAGFTIIRRTPVVLTLLLTGIVLNLFVVPLTSVILPVIGETVFGQTIAFTLLLAGFRVGTVLGNWSVSRLRWDSTSTYTAGILLTGITTTATGGAGAILTGSFGIEVPTTAALGFLTLLLVTVGAVQPLYNVAQSSIVQSAVSDERRGTVLSVKNAVMEASFPLPLVAAGYLLGVVSPFTLLTVAGVGTLALAVVTERLLTRTSSDRREPEAVMEG